MVLDPVERVLVEVADDVSAGKREGGAVLSLSLSQRFSLSLTFILCMRMT